MAHVAGVILAGGKASRLEGRDKATLGLAGLTLVQHCIARLEPQVQALAINANGDPARFASHYLPVLLDIHEGFQGPLAGIHATLVWAKSLSPAPTNVVTVAIDTPFFPLDLVERLTRASQPNRVSVASSQGRLHPTFALWPLAALDVVEEQIRAGDLKLTRTMDRLGFDEVAFEADDADDPFFNINTPADLEAAEMRAPKDAG
jgi:molybdenum cofactor guanylyltransferase